MHGRNSCGIGSLSKCHPRFLQRQYILSAHAMRLVLLFARSLSACAIAHVSAWTVQRCLSCVLACMFPSNSVASWRTALIPRPFCQEAAAKYYVWLSVVATSCPPCHRRFLLEWLSFLHRYVPVALLEVVPQRLNWRPPAFVGRSDLETWLASDNPADWCAPELRCMYDCQKKVTWWILLTGAFYTNTQDKELSFHIKFCWMHTGFQKHAFLYRRGK